jgi:hypothetical protein
MLDGTTFECRELGPLEISEIAQLQGVAADSAKAVAFMSEFFASILGPTQYPAFREMTVRNTTKPEILVEIIQGIFEDFTNRPTVQPSESSDGLPNIETKSSDALSDRVIERLKGRPDLQTAVILARSTD